MNKLIKSISFVREPDLLEAAMTKAEQKHGGNFSRYIMSLIRKDQAK